MANNEKNEWIPDLQAMVCRNANSKIEVCFEKSGGRLTGEIKYIPMELFGEWAKLPEGHELISKAVFDAEEVFFKVYFESLLSSTSA